jgi:hypothetical protein
MFGVWTLGAMMCVWNALWGVLQVVTAINGVGWPVLQRYSYTAVLIMYATNLAECVGYQVKRKRYERGTGKEE